MKLINIALTGLLLGCSPSYAWQPRPQWKPFTSLEGGYSYNDDKGVVSELRVGASNGLWELSGGFEKKYADVDLNTVNFQALRTFQIGLLTAGLGGNLGYTVPHGENLYDNSLSGSLVGKVSYKLTPNISFNMGVSRFMSHIDTRRIEKVDSTEPIFADGVQIGTVETEQINVVPDSLNLNSVDYTFGVRWEF